MNMTRQLIQRAGIMFISLWLVVFVISMWPACCEATDAATTGQHHEHTATSENTHTHEHHDNTAESHYCDSDSYPGYLDGAFLLNSAKKDVVGYLVAETNNYNFLNLYIESDKFPVVWLQPIFLRSVYLVTNRLRI